MKSINRQGVHGIVVAIGIPLRVTLFVGRIGIVLAFREAVGIAVVVASIVAARFSVIKPLIVVVVIRPGIGVVIGLPIGVLITLVVPVRLATAVTGVVGVGNGAVKRDLIVGADHVGLANRVPR